MYYESSRNKSDRVSAHEAVIKGLADDGGLYTPNAMPAGIPVSEVLSLSYQETAAKIIRTMLDDYSEEEIRDCVNGAYDSKFDSDEIVPLHPIKDAWLMELWHGPTSAFKDIALTLLPRLLTAAYRKDNRNDTVSILTATSGDTGKAALSGFADVPHTAITVFYPEVGVSPIQKKQMQTSKGDNVEVIAVKGNFDDCQRMVKKAVSDPEVKSSLHNVTISSANSINIGRLMPQIVYYYTSYAKLVSQKAIKCGDLVNFAVPTGNFGDILAGYFAHCLGLPINHLICASNTNNVLTDFLKTGTYSIQRPFHTTMSPSMDILISSNLERLLFIMSNYDDIAVQGWMKDLNEKGSFSIPADMLSRIQELFKGVWTNEKECEDTIRTLYKEENTLIDPHTAVALHAMRKYREETGDSTPCIVLSTASPYKFSADVLKCISNETYSDDFAAMDRLHELSGVKVPANLSALRNLPVRFKRSIEQKDGMHAIAERMKEIGNVHD
jgi:threonine synthase